jgi:hypothetical protein
VRAVRLAARPEPLKALAVRVPKTGSTFLKVLVSPALRTPLNSFPQPVDKPVDNLFICRVETFTLKLDTWNAINLLHRAVTETTSD